MRKPRGSYKHLGKNSVQQLLTERRNTRAKQKSAFGKLNFKMICVIWKTRDAENA